MKKKRQNGTICKNKNLPENNHEEDRSTDSSKAGKQPTGYKSFLEEEEEYTTNRSEIAL